MVDEIRKCKFQCYIFKFNYCKLLHGLYGEKTTNGWGKFLLQTKYNGWYSKFQGIPGK